MKTWLHKFTVATLVIRLSEWTKEENTAFNLWAFGWRDVYFSTESISHLDIMNLWNERHSDLLMLEPEGTIKYDLAEMWALWEKHR